MWPLVVLVHCPRYLRPDRETTRAGFRATSQAEIGRRFGLTASVSGRLIIAPHQDGGEYNKRADDYNQGHDFKGRHNDDPLLANLICPEDNRLGLEAIDLHQFGCCRSAGSN